MPTDVEIAPARDTELVIRRVLRATPAAVWRCWSEPELLRQWYCPAPWTVSRAEIDLRPGGASLVVMNGPNGEVHDNPGQYLVVEPGRRLVMTSAFAGDWQPLAGELPLTVFVDLEPHAEGTLLTWGARHWSRADTVRHEEMGFHAGWSAAAAQLEALAASLPGGAVPTPPAVCLWFDRDGEQAANAWIALLGGRVLSVSRYGAGGPMPAGLAMMVSFELRGRRFQALNGGPLYPHTPAASLVIECDTQEEIDRLWDGLLADGGRPSRCGWLTDRFGVSWQVVPRPLGAWMTGDPAGAARVGEALLAMDKLDLAALAKAYADA